MANYTTESPIIIGWTSDNIDFNLESTFILQNLTDIQLQCFGELKIGKKAHNANQIFPNPETKISSIHRFSCFILHNLPL